MPETIDIATKGSIAEKAAPDLAAGIRRSADAHRQNFEALANCSADFMTLINRRYTYDAANLAYCRARGKTADEILGAAVEDLWGSEVFRTIIRDCLDRCFSGEEVLLREIHHRVKNNLNVIISLIDMQERQSADEEVSTALTELQERIRAIAMVHEDLYQSENLARIAFRNYLENLVTDLFIVFDSEGISLDLAVTDAALTADTAIPAGLIVNELITNALKHAFPKGSRKRRENRSQIRIVFRRENGMCLLTVQDNGMGLPPDLDWRAANSLGLRMIRILAKQLMGTIQVDDGEGTTISVAFPAVSNRPVFSRKPSDAEKDPHC